MTDDTKKDSVFLPEEEVYHATFGAMMARQVMDRMAEGRGAPEDAAMDDFVEEADRVARLTLEAVARWEVEDYQRRKQGGDEK